MGSNKSTTPDETGALSRGLLLLEILGQSWDAPEREKEIKYVRNWQEFLKEDGDVGGDAFLSKKKKKKKNQAPHACIHWFDKISWEEWFWKLQN